MSRVRLRQCFAEPAPSTCDADSTSGSGSWFLSGFVSLPLLLCSLPVGRENFGYLSWCRRISCRFFSPSRGSRTNNGTNRWQRQGGRRLSAERFICPHTFARTPSPLPSGFSADVNQIKTTLRETSVACQRLIGYLQRLLDVSTQCPSPVKARSSVGERFLDTEEVGGSIPPVPTRSVPTAARAIYFHRFTVSLFRSPVPAMIKFFA